MTAAPFCNACGARFEGDDRFCANCGAGRPLVRPIEEPTMSYDRNEQPGAQRPYASLLPYQQPGRPADEPLGWFPAVLLALIPAVLIGVYVGSTETQEITVGARGTVEVDNVAAGTQQGVIWAIGWFIGLVVTIRAFFALLNIERSLRAR